MDVVETRIRSFKMVKRSWNIFLSSFFNHLNEKTRSKKMELGGMLTYEEDVAGMISFTLAMYECKLSINPTSMNDEGCNINTNKGYNIFARYIRK
jgi:hypothetical protein